MSEDTKYKKFLGYKFFKDLGDNKFEIIRVIRVYDNSSFKVKFEDGSTKTINAEWLAQYTPLEPNNVATFNIVLTGMTFDVIVCIYKLFEIKINEAAAQPEIICRQGARDFFYDLCCKGDPETENHYVGISVSRATCPANLDFLDLLGCDMVVDTKMVHFYREDTIKDVLDCIPQMEFNKVLEKLYTEHIESLKEFNPFLKDRDEHDGWCKSLEKLLMINNIDADINAMQNITGVDFELGKHLIQDNDIYKLDHPALIFFNYTFKVNAVDTRVIEYDNSVNLADFNNSNYTMIRDKKNKLFIIVYLVQGEYLEAELEAEMNKLSVTEKLGLTYINKYKRDLNK